MKKGQTTLFVIIGIVIVILLGLGIYYREAIVSTLTGTQATQTQIFEGNVNTITNYVETCLAETTQQAIDIISLQGGYLEVPDDPLALDGVNTMSNALTVLPGLYVPYWYYETGNGIKKNQIPTQATIEEGIQTYLNENFELCINNFTQAQPLTITHTKPTFSVDIKDDNVDVIANYPLTIQQDNFTTQLNRFTQTIQTPLGEYYETAVAIMQTENRETFLETKTLDQFVVYEELPKSGLDFSCSPQTWERTQVIQDLKGILQANIAHLKVEGANYELAEGREYYEIDAGNPPRNSNVQFTYSQDWPLLIDIIPDDQILRGESYNDNSLGQFVTQFFCLNYYNFVYDLKYPILISLSDEETGYTFQFATQVIIDNNQPRQSIPLEQLDQSTSIICDYPSTPVTIQTQGYSTNGNIIPLSDAQVYITCGGATCTLGKTGLTGSVNTLAPQCLNANIRVQHENYQTTTDIINTIEPETLSITLEPKKQLNLSMQLIREDGSTRGLLNGELVLVQLVHEEESFSTGALYPQQTTLELIPGTYELRTTIIRETSNGFTLQEETIETCIDKPRSGILGVLGVTEKDCTETTLEGTKLDSIISGGTTTTYTIGRQELLNNNRITISSIINDAPERITDLQGIYGNITINAQKSIYQEPRLS